MFPITPPLNSTINIVLKPLIFIYIRTLGGGGGYSIVNRKI
jgi:hypothetical protein